MIPGLPMILSTHALQIGSLLPTPSIFCTIRYFLWIALPDCFLMTEKPTCVLTSLLDAFLTYSPGRTKRYRYFQASEKKILYPALRCLISKVFSISINYSACVLFLKYPHLSSHTFQTSYFFISNSLIGI